MVKKKPLTKEQSEICKKNLGFLKKERFDLFDEVNVCKAYLHVVIDGNARQQKKQFRKRLENAEKGLQEINKTISVLKDQIQNGVEVKPKKEDVKNG